MKQVWPRPHDYVDNLNRYGNLSGYPLDLCHVVPTICSIWIYHNMVPGLIQETKLY
jgi:hypothetical protein